MTLEEKMKLRQPCIVMTRCCGWLVDKKSSNPGKQSEYYERKEYVIDYKTL